MNAENKTSVVIGTRGSPLALVQAEMLATALRAKHPHLAAKDAIRFEIIVTSGDRIQDRPLSEAGGKGLFTKEIEEALLDGRIDCAVHSMKDMPTQLPKGLSIPCLLPRDDVRDAFFSRNGGGLDDLPQGATFDTSTGAFSWQPTQAGTYTFIAEASDGTSVTTRRVIVEVAADRQAAVATVAAPFKPDTLYVTATKTAYENAYADMQDTIGSSTDATYFQKLGALRNAVSGLREPTPNPIKQKTAEQNQ